MPNEVEQKFQEERRSGIGGSDAAAVCGVDPYRTPLDIYEQKLGIAPPREPNIHMERGVRNEPWAIDHFEAETGFVVLRSPPVMRNKAEPWMIVHLDGLVVEAEEADGPVPSYPLEVKCPTLHNFYAAKQGGATDGMVCQLQHGMAVEGESRGWFVVFHSDVGHIRFPMDRDDALIARIMERERTFWTEYVEKETPPPEVFGIEAAEELALPEGIGAEVVQIESEAWAKLMGKIRDARQIRDEAAAYYGIKDKESGEYSGLLGELAGMMAHLGIDAAEGGGGKVYHRQHQGARYFDEKRLRTAAPLDVQAVQDRLLELLPQMGVAAKADAKSVIAAVKDCRLDLSQFERRRSPYRSLRIYHQDEA